MSGYAWGMAREGRPQIVTRESAPDAWNLPEPDPRVPWQQVGVTASFALGVFDLNGEWIVLEGEATEIVDYADRLHAYVHRRLDGQLVVPVENDETRACALCGDEVLILSSRDWCDGCEATVIPASVWRAFVARQATSDDQGEVSLSAVVDALLGMIAAEHMRDGHDDGRPG